MQSKYIKDHKYPHCFNENGLEPTKNRMGGMHTLSEYSAMFVESSAIAKLPVVDIGCAYGVATIPALEKGAKVYAVDIEQSHLDILLDRTPAHLTKNLTVINATFPDSIDFPANSITAVLMSRVLSFLTPEQIQTGLKKIYNWLAPGGTVFAVNHTPYIKLFEDFIPEYETRQKSGELWPGLIPDLSGHPKYEFYKMPAWINLMDIDIIQRIFADVGFSLEKLEYFNSSEIVPVRDVQFDGRELVGCIATKDK